MSRLLTAALLALIAPAAQATIIGNIDSVTVLSDDSFQIKGWACSTVKPESISVHVYVGGPAGVGTAMASGLANLPSEAGISTACQDTGVPHRFAITVPKDKRKIHANKLIYVHGISTSGESNLTITDSGTMKVPALLVVTRQYVYGDDLRLCKVIEPETGATTTQYDAAGNVVWTASGLDLPDPEKCNRGDLSYLSGRRVDRTYDARNRVKSLVFPDNRGNLDYTYGADGKVASIVAHNDGVGQNVVTTTYDYNVRGLLTSERMKFGSIDWPVGYSYDKNGNLAQQQYRLMSVDYAPNALGQPTKAGTFASSVTYYPGGALKQFTYGNGYVHTMTQNDRGLPKRSVDSLSGQPDAIDDNYTYDANGNVAAILDGATADGRGDRVMTYDGLDRLVRAESKMFGTDLGDHAAAYTYDGVDNLTRVTINSTPTVPGRDHYYCYMDGTQRLTNIMTAACSSSGTTVMGLSYDLQGNLSNRSGQNFDFDYGNRLRRVYPNTGSTIASYLYDGQGRRIRDLTTASKYSMYGLDGELLLTVDNRQGGEYDEYVYLGGSLLAIRERTGPSNAYVYTTKYQHTDALGSPVAETGASGQLVGQRQEYEPYGKVLAPLPVSDGPGFTGHVLDANTGLNYMQQRYYDPVIGRFLSSDPVGAGAATGANFNRYVYANGNPYTFVDPDGRLAERRDDSPFGNNSDKFGPCDLNPSCWGSAQNDDASQRGNSSSQSSQDWASSTGNAYAAKTTVQAKVETELAAGNWEAALEYMELGSANDVTPAMQQLVRSAARLERAGYNGNSLSHVFKAKHQLDAFVAQSGSQHAALLRIHDAAQVIARGAVNGYVERGTIIRVGQSNIWVQGKVINGVFRISSASMRGVP